MTDNIKSSKESLLKNITKNLLFPGITGLLILIVIFQALQVQEIKGYMHGFVQAQESKVSNTATTAPVSSSRSNNNTGLASQVGGC